MKKIVGILRPFDYNQQFFVFENGNRLASFSMSVTEIPDEILAIAKKYEITQVDLTGPKQYATGIKKRILENELKTYSENSLTINLI